MKFLKYPILTVALVMGLASCDNNDDEEFVEPVVPVGGNTFVDFQNRQGLDFSYNRTDGAWTGCYDPAQTGALTFAGLNFSHSVTTYDGGQTYYWGGFCPSNSSENADHSSQDWTLWQWSNITARGLYVNQYMNWTVASGAPFMVADWDCTELTTGIPSSPSLKVQAADGQTRFVPKGIWITNSTYGYYVMQNGSAFSKVFGADDWCKVYIYGVKGGMRKGPIEVSLYDGSKEEGQRYLRDWVFVEENVGSTLGEVDYIYFQMASSDTGECGMNNPAYFCIGGIVLEPVQ